MFGNRSFLMLGSAGGSNILDLMKGGLEILDCNFSFQQGIDNKGKATTDVHGGIISLLLQQLPPKEIIEWALNSRKYLDGSIILLDGENLPVEKIIFSNTACVGMGISYTQGGNSYACTRLVIHAEKIQVGNGVDFENKWTK